MKIQERKGASNSPTGHQKSRNTSRRPRRCGGRYSVSIDGSTTSIPPAPHPPRKGKVRPAAEPDAGQEAERQHRPRPPCERRHGREDRVPKDRVLEDRSPPDPVR